EERRATRFGMASEYPPYFSGTGGVSERSKPFRLSLRASRLLDLHDDLIGRPEQAGASGSGDREDVRASPRECAPCSRRKPGFRIAAIETSHRGSTADGSVSRAGLL